MDKFTLALALVLSTSTNLRGLSKHYYYNYIQILIMYKLTPVSALALVLIGGRLANIGTIYLQHLG